MLSAVPPLLSATRHRPAPAPANTSKNGRPFTYPHAIPTLSSTADAAFQPTIAAQPRSAAPRGNQRQPPRLSAVPHSEPSSSPSAAAAVPFWDPGSGRKFRHLSSCRHLSIDLPRDESQRMQRTQRAEGRDAMVHNKTRRERCADDNGIQKGPKVAESCAGAVRIGPQSLNRTKDCERSGVFGIVRGQKHR